MRGLAISHDCIRSRVGFLELKCNSIELPAPGHLRGFQVQPVRLPPLAMDIAVGRLQAETEVLFGLACEPLNFPRDACGIIGDIGHFEEALMNPRSTDVVCTQLVRHFPGFWKAVRADVGGLISAAKEARG